MRSKLGSIVKITVSAAAVATLGFAGTSPAQAGTPPESSAPDTTSPPEPIVDPSTTTAPTTAPPTTAPPTTAPPTTAPPTTVPLVAELPPPPARITPSRGTQAQVAETVPQVPTTTTTTTTLPPHDALPANSGVGRRVVYSKSKMRVWTVEADGHVSKTHLVSGRRTWDQPRPGTYSVFSRSSYTCNINNPHICWRYMVRFTKGPGGDNIGFHEIPTNTQTGAKLQSVSQLGQALSGGCVRQATPDARFMWNWAPIGTKVVVLG